MSDPKAALIKAMEATGLASLHLGCLLMVIPFLLFMAVVGYALAVALWHL